MPAEKKKELGREKKGQGWYFSKLEYFYDILKMRLHKVKLGFFSCILNGINNLEPNFHVASKIYIWLKNDQEQTFRFKVKILRFKLIFMAKVCSEKEIVDNNPEFNRNMNNITCLKICHLKQNSYKD